MENLQPKPARRSAAKTIWAPTALTLPKSSDGSSTVSVSTQTVATSAKLQERPARIAATACNALFVLLVVVNVIRTLHHAMWRDELQSFMLALYSSSPWDLLQKLKYEGHPGLWHALLWMVTRVTSDPLWMQVLHIGLAIGVWVIIYRWSPFSKIEKFLLLLSYFLFWEYFIISRNYVLIALTAFAFLALRDRQPRPDFLLWLLLGLLANTHIFGAIWSIALAVGTFDRSGSTQVSAHCRTSRLCHSPRACNRYGNETRNKTSNRIWFGDRECFVQLFTPQCRSYPANWRIRAASTRFNSGGHRVHHGSKSCKYSEVLEFKFNRRFGCTDACGYRSSSQAGIIICRADYHMLADHARPVTRPGICPRVFRHRAIREPFWGSPRCPHLRYYIFGFDRFSVERTLTSFAYHFVLLSVGGASYR